MSEVSELSAVQDQRENARQILQASGCARILKKLNKEQLKERGWFVEYDSGVIFKWGQGRTRRHIWIHIDGENIQFKLQEHRQCVEPIPLCNGEYHTLTRELWQNYQVLFQEIMRNYQHPVAESSDD